MLVAPPAATAACCVTALPLWAAGPHLPRGVIRVPPEAPVAGGPSGPPDALGGGYGIGPVPAVNATVPQPRYLAVLTAPSVTHAPLACLAFSVLLGPQLKPVVLRWPVDVSAGLAVASSPVGALAVPAAVLHAPAPEARLQFPLRTAALCARGCSLCWCSLCCALLALLLLLWLRLLLLLRLRLLLPLPPRQLVQQLPLLAK